MNVIRLNNNQLKLLAMVFMLCDHVGKALLPRWLSGTDFQIDYGLFGVLLPVAVYFAPTKPAKLAACAAALTVVALMLGGLQWYSLLALPLLALYNGQRGKWKLKYLFYIFYPAHLVLIYLISLLL